MLAFPSIQIMKQLDKFKFDKKVVTGICILLAIVLLIPIPMRLKDGGTVVYNAILYQVENVHRIDPEATSENDYLEGMIVKILGIEVYNNVE